MAPFTVVMFGGMTVVGWVFDGGSVVLFLRRLCPLAVTHPVVPKALLHIIPNGRLVLLL